jgi:hypothetical protein
VSMGTYLMLPGYSHSSLNGESHKDRTFQKEKKRNEITNDGRRELEGFFSEIELPVQDIVM